MKSNDSVEADTLARSKLENGLAGEKELSSITNLKEAQSGVEKHNSWRPEFKRKLHSRELHSEKPKINKQNTFIRSDDACKLKKIGERKLTGTAKASRTVENAFYPRNKTSQENQADKLPELARNKQPRNPSAEKRKMPKELAQRLRSQQDKVLKQIADKKEAKRRTEEEAREKKARMMSRLAEEAKANLEKASKLEPKEKSEPKSQPRPAPLPPQEALRHHENFIARNLVQKKCDLRGITDLAVWKKKQNIDESTKVFVVVDGYPDIRKALKKRGWVANKQRHSVCFDFKWTLKHTDIDYQNLQDNQIVNHFENNSQITTKSGLCRNLHNLVWHSNVDIDTFYPRCYNATDPIEMDDFKQDFKAIKAECVLKEYARTSGVGEEKLLVALNVCEKRMRDIDDALDDPNVDTELVSDTEWEILGNDEITQEALAKKKHEAWFTKLMKKFNGAKTVKKVGKKKDKGEKEEEKKGVVDKGNAQCNEASDNKSIKERVEAVLKKLKEKYPQFEANGTKNIWIVKPAGMSRGRGIKIFNNLAEILDYAQCREQKFVIQKYIENPMIVLNRKYDIRQWVLVTGWNTMSVWFYKDCYVRFGAVDYDVTRLHSRYSHLTNNCVTKNCDEGEIEGNMWDLEEYTLHLKEKYGEDMFERKIQPMMKKIVVWSLECVQEGMINRRRSCELLGYDFMVDDECNPWLIEVNLSPAMDYSTVSAWGHGRL